MSLSLLLITDGTNTVDLLGSRRAGWKLDSYNPGRLQLKGGGIYRDSAITDGRQLIDYRWADIVDTFVFKLVAKTQDINIRQAQDVDRLLIQAVNYWKTRWSNTPVWLVRRGKKETNTSYAIIKGFRLPDDDNPFAQPFSSAFLNSVNTNVILAMEHGPWMENEPKTGTAAAIFASESYDGRNLGTVDDTGTDAPTAVADSVFVSNKRPTANLTDIYYFDATGPGAFSANLMDAALPYSLLPAIPGVGDIIYFGIDSTLTDSGPFSNIIVDIGTAGAGYSGTWEYYNGAWVGFTPEFNSNPGSDITQATGVQYIVFDQPSDWTTVAINAITAYWVRFRLTAVPGPVTVPTQQNRDIYSCVMPYIEMQSTIVGGDIPALSEMTVNPKSAIEDPVQLAFAMGAIVGLRSNERGTDFTAYLNLGDEQNPTGITTVASISTAFVTDTTTPSGRAARYTPVGADAFAERASVTFSSAIADDYVGRFRTYLRFYASGTTTEFSFRLKINTTTGTPATLFTSEQVDVIYSGVLTNYIELGAISLPPYGDQTFGDVVGFALSLEVATDSNTDTLTFVDLILIPVDEWAASYLPFDNGLNISTRLYQDTTYLEAGAVSNPKRHIALLQDAGGSGAIAAFHQIKNGQSILRENAAQRLWFFFPGFINALDRATSSILFLATIDLEKTNRYTGFRGAR